MSTKIVHVSDEKGNPQPVRVPISDITFWSGGDASAAPIFDVYALGVDGDGAKTANVYSNNPITHVWEPMGVTYASLYGG